VVGVLSRLIDGPRARVASSLVLTTTMLVAVGCDDPCASSDEPTLELGTIEGASTFEPTTAGDEVGLGFAPQGGQGVFMAIRAIGLEAHPNLAIFAKQVELNVRMMLVAEDGTIDVLGDFPTSATIRCVEGEGGIVSQAAFGLDAERFGFGVNPDDPNDPLAALDGQTITLEAEVKDVNGRGGTVSADVVLRTSDQP
jgi:hypothetical protein